MTQNGSTSFRILCSFCTVVGILWSSEASAQFFGRFFWEAPLPARAPLIEPSFPVAVPKKQVIVRKPKVIDLIEVRKNDEKVKELRAVARDVSVEAALQLDKTLRFGDIAVLSSGLHVFRGKSTEFHRESDFQPLAQSDLRRRADLSAIQKAGAYQVASHGGFIAITTVRPIGRFSEVRAKTTGGFKTISIGQP